MRFWSLFHFFKLSPHVIGWRCSTQQYSFWVTRPFGKHAWTPTPSPSGGRTWTFCGSGENRLVESSLLFSIFSVELPWHEYSQLFFFSTSVPVVSVCCLIFGSTWTYLLQPPSEEVTPNYGLAVVLICVACFVEKLVEPLFVAAQALRYVRTKVSLLRL
jgi:hypothetical protein